MENVAVRKAYTRFWAWMVAILGGALILLSLAVTYGALFRPGLGWWLTAILTVVILGGVLVLWAPILLLVASLFVWLFVPPDGLRASAWRYYLWQGESRRRGRETSRSDTQPVLPSAPRAGATAPSSRRRPAGSCR